MTFVHIAVLVSIYTHSILFVLWEFNESKDTWVPVVLKGKVFGFFSFSSSCFVAR